MADEGFWAGLSKGLFRRVRFGGVVGKACLMFALVGVAAAFALRAAAAHPYGPAAVMVLAVCALIALGLILLFAHKHPDLAMLEGSQWLQYQQMVQSKNTPPQLATAPVEAELVEPAPEQLALQGQAPTVVITPEEAGERNE